MKNVLTFVLLLLIMKGVFGEFVSVMDGDYVTLHTGVAEVQNFKVIDWRFGDVRVAQINRAANIFETYDNELGGKFKGRLKLDVQTGDLNISDISSTDTGSFKVTITSNIKTIKTFSLTVERAVAVGPVSVMEQDSVTLHTDVTKIERYDVVQWRFHNSLVAEINRHAGIFKTHDGPDGTFTGRLQLECLTGSLTITNTRKTDFGSYEVALSSNSSKHTIHRTFTLTVSDSLELVSVEEGGRVTLNSTLTKIQIYDFIQWMFGDTVIAKINQTVKQSNGDDKRFKDRLKVNDQTGSLTITEIRKTDSGLYKLQVSNSRSTILRRITVTVGTGLSPGDVAGIVVPLVLAAAAVTVFVFFYYRHKISELERQKMKTITEVEGRDVTLHTDIEINKDVRLLWLVGETNCLIADIKGGTGEIIIYDIRRFRDRLKVDKKTGNLTITDITTNHAGLYKLKINSDKGSTYSRFNVFVRERMRFINKGKSVTLNVAEIPKNDHILWTFEKCVIAQIKEGICTYKEEGLKLDETGSLTITNITAEHAGIYELISSRRTSYRKFKLVVCDELVPATKGGSVTLKAGLPEIQKNNQILWMFEGHDSPIAEIKGGTGETPTYDDGPDGKFKDTLKLDMKTGDLTIKNITAEHDGHYKLLTSSGHGATSRRFNVSVREKQVDESEMVLLDEEDPDVVNEVISLRPR